MRIVTLEEHVNFPDLSEAIPQELAAERGWPPPDSDMSPLKRVGELLNEVGPKRIESMDAAGITMQVLSQAGAGADLLPPQPAVQWARQFNERLAQKMREYPGRFSAFAHLPMTAPQAAADELERAVSEDHFCGALINGTTNDLFLDEPSFAPILERAEKLDVPIYLHPNLPPPLVFDKYYSRLKPVLSQRLSTAGWGWHSETAIHVLRLILSGTLDRYPGLRLIIGHMGEMIPMMMVRCDQMMPPKATGLERGIAETLRAQVSITTSGIFTNPPLQAAIATFGIDNILFSVDYPFSENKQGRRFLDDCGLSTDDLGKLAHGNADRLLKLNP